MIVEFHLSVRSEVLERYSEPVHI